jgi:hypothetical protein
VSAGGPGDAPRSRLPRMLALGALGVLLVVVTLNTLRTPGGSSSGPRPGTPMAPFAAPLATSAITGDVNVATRARQGAAGALPACRVRGPGILTSCDLVRGTPAAIAFFVPGRARCVDQLDALAVAARAHPRVRVAAIALRGDRGSVRALVRAHRWPFPVGYDRDAVLANLYGVAACPQITFVLRGGAVESSTVGSLDAAGVAARLTRLEQALPATAGGAP